MISQALKTTFLKVLLDMKLFKEDRDEVEVDEDQNLIEISTKAGRIYSFYLDPIKSADGSYLVQITCIDEGGKKRRGLLHSETDEQDIHAGLRKVFM